MYVAICKYCRGLALQEGDLIRQVGLGLCENIHAVHLMAGYNLPFPYALLRLITIG